jgi:hypothetical protein
LCNFTKSVRLMVNTLSPFFSSELVTISFFSSYFSAKGVISVLMFSN